MHFLAEDVATAHQPTAAELKAWYEKNNRAFALPSRATFRTCTFHRIAAGNTPEKTRESAGEDRWSAGGLEVCRLDSRSFYVPGLLRRRQVRAIGQEFGPEFAQALFQLKPGSWQGPIESGYGWHLVFVDSFTPGRIPAFEEVEPDVKTAWLADQKQRAWNKAYRDMRAKYTVFLPAPPETQSASAPAPPPKQIPTSFGEGPQ